jgi:hypothetical protein
MVASLSACPGREDRLCEHVTSTRRLNAVLARGHKEQRSFSLVSCGTCGGTGKGATMLAALHQMRRIVAPKLYGS